MITSENGGRVMAKTVSIGTQDYAALIERDCFYIDKTDFIKEWWESEDAVTLITRPRRFTDSSTEAAPASPQAVRKDPKYEHAGMLFFQ